jgi:hypothetical protein
MSNATFIGKGKQVNGRIQVSIKMSDAEAFITDYEGEKYLHFNVVPLKEKTKFGKTHTLTAYMPEAKPAEA